MGRKTVLVAGATGLVGYAALKHFIAAPDTDVIAISRRVPPGMAVRHLALDLADPHRLRSRCGRIAERHAYCLCGPVRTSRPG